MELTYCVTATVTDTAQHNAFGQQKHITYLPISELPSYLFMTVCAMVK